MRNRSEMINALAGLNADLPRGAHVVAFRVEWDEDVRGMVAEVLFHLSDDDATWQVENTNRLCDLAYEALRDYVEMTFCSFGTDDSVESALAVMSWTMVEEAEVAA